ncbi:MAG: alkene reductase, partial [Endozoicomonas sp.]
FGIQKGDAIGAFKTHFDGNLIVNMGYTREEGDQVIADGQADAVAYGVPFIANPDLVERFKQNAALAEADPKTFYSPGPHGYIDYPALND